MYNTYSSIYSVTVNVLSKPKTDRLRQRRRGLTWAPATPEGLVQAKPHGLHATGADDRSSEPTKESSEGEASLRAHSCLGKHLDGVERVADKLAGSASDAAGSE